MAIKLERNALATIYVVVRSTLTQHIVHCMHTLTGHPFNKLFRRIIIKRPYCTRTPRTWYMVITLIDFGNSI